MSWVQAFFYEFNFYLSKRPMKKESFSCKLSFILLYTRELAYAAAQLDSCRMTCVIKACLIVTPTFHHIDSSPGEEAGLFRAHAGFSTPGAHHRASRELFPKQRVAHLPVSLSHLAKEKSSPPASFHKAHKWPLLLFSTLKHSWSHCWLARKSLCSRLGLQKPLHRLDLLATGSFVLYRVLLVPSANLLRDNSVAIWSSDLGIAADIDVAFVWG